LLLAPCSQRYGDLVNIRLLYRRTPDVRKSTKPVQKHNACSGQSAAQQVLDVMQRTASSSLGIQCPGTRDQGYGLVPVVLTSSRIA